MMALFAALGPAWTWIIAGLLLGAGELAMPGVFLIWLGMACIATGLVASVSLPAWPVQVLVFAAFAIAAVLFGRRLTRDPPSLLNRRGHNLVGTEVVLTTPILNGVGRLSQADTSWRIVGPDLSAGTRVRVVSLDGVTLVVEPSVTPVSA